MTFSQKVKTEVALATPKARHCKIAELAGIVFFSKIEMGDGTIRLVRAAEEAARVFDELVSGLGTDILATLKLENGSAALPDTVNAQIVQSGCCRQAYIRGAFLAAGSLNDPMHGYHLEISCDNETRAQQLAVLCDTGVGPAKVSSRKNNYVVYCKEGEQIVDMLGIMGAHKALLEMENARIVREMRGDINRRVNCEASNIHKTVSAAQRQIDAIEKIEKLQGLKSLPEHLRQMAQVRLEYPQAPLEELGEYLDPPVGKSGVNHRLRKIVEIAEKM